MPRILLAGLMILALVMSGCKITGSKANNSQAALRVAHLDAGAGAINMAVVDSNNNSITPTAACPCDVTGLSFQGVSNYVNYDSGTAKTFTVFLGDGSATLATPSFTLASNTNYTLIMYGSAGSPGAMLLADNNIQTPASGSFEIRPVHAAVNTSAMDFYVVPVTNGATLTPASIASAAPSFNSFSLTGVPLFVQYTAGTYVLFATPSGSKTVTYQSAPIQFNSGDIATAIVYTSGSGTLTNVELTYEDNSAGGTTTHTTTVLESNLYSQVKITNASPTVGSINFLANAKGMFANVPYTGTSSYALTPAVNTLLEAQATSAPGTDVATLQTSFSGGNDYSAMLAGNSASLSLVVFPPDINLPPSVGNARLRFVNASPNAGPLDIQVNFAAVPAASALGTNKASPYVNFLQNPLPGYTITANLSGTGSTALTLPGVEVVAGSTYTIYIMGNAGALQGVISKDN